MWLVDAHAHHIQWGPPAHMEMMISVESAESVNAAPPTSTFMKQVRQPS